MAKGISLRAAKSEIQEELGSAVTSQGFEERQIGPHIVNIFYYKYEVQFKDAGNNYWSYKLAVFVNGQKRSGIFVD